MTHRQVINLALVISGSLACFPLSALSQVADITVLHGGFADSRSTLTSVPDFIRRGDKLFVIDEGNRQIVVLDLSGAIIAKWGGEGDGPGEYRAPTRIGFLGDTIWVVDRSNQRLTLLNLEGDVVETLQLRSPQIGYNLYPAAPSALLQGGRFVASPRYSLMDGMERELPHTPLLLVSRDQMAVDTLGMYPTAGRTWVTTDPEDPGGRRGRVAGGSPFGTRAVWDATSDGRFIAWGEVDAEARSIKITVFDAVSRARRYCTIPFTPQSVSEGQIDRAVDDRVAVMRQFPQFGTTPRARLRIWARESLPLPEHIPPVSSMVVARSGDTVWLRRTPTPDGRRPWEAYDLTGVLLKRILLPIDLEVRDATADALWGVLPDDLDVPQIVRVSWH